MILILNLYHYKNPILWNIWMKMYNKGGQMQINWHIPSYLIIPYYPLKNTCDARKNSYTYICLIIHKCMKKYNYQLVSKRQQEWLSENMNYNSTQIPNLPW
jgi:hypothetical protein